MNCPIPTNPQWKALVKKNGRKKAMQIYVANNYQVPDVKSIPKTMFDVIKGFAVSQSSTLQRLKDDPELTSKVINDLKKAMPNVIINKEGIIKEDGTFVPLKAGEMGESIRNSLHSMVAWANDAYLETPPHEYAHIYIDMYRNAPMVKEAIEKYGEEKLVEKIGRYYTEQYTAPGFKKWVQKFWNMLRAMFGQPNIRYELFKSFKDNKQLSTDTTRGTDIVRYQKIKTPYKRNDTAYVENEQLKAQVDFDSQQAYNYKNDTKGIQKKVALKKLVFDLMNSDYYSNNKNYNKITLDSLVPGELAFTFANLDKSAIKESLIGLREFYNKKIEDLKEVDKDQSSKYKEVNFFDTNDLNNIKNSYSVANTTNSDAILAWSMFTLLKLDNQGDRNLLQQFQWEKFGIKEGSKKATNVITEGTKLARNIYDIQKRIERVKWQKKNLVLPNGKSISIEAASKISENEIESASKQREDFWYNKGFIGQNPALKKFFKVIVQLLNTYLSNARLQSKFLSGQSDSAIQQMLYEEFEHANHAKLKIKQAALLSFNQVIKNSKNLDGSFFKNQTQDINQLSTVEVDLGGKKVKLTEAELLNLYLMIRMDSSKDDSRSTKDQILEDGIVLQNVIEGRDLATRKFLPTLTDLNNIKSKIESNERMKKNVALIDTTMSFLYEKLNKAHVDELGVELKNVKNYFPVSYGLKSETDVRNRKSMVDFIGARYDKKTDRQPVRIRDTYQVVENYTESASHYSAYVLPITNARKLIKSLKRKYEKNVSRKDYKTINDLITALEGNVNNLEDNSILYSSQGAKKSAKFFNKIMSNFSTSVLALNVPTMFKQPISYQAAAEVIDVKFLQMAGWGKGMIAGIGYQEVFNQIHKKKIGDNNSMFPIEFRMDDSNPLYAIMKKYSPIFAERFEGAISKETGEALMDSRIGDDLINIPFTKGLRKVLVNSFGFKEGGNLAISKNAAMSGIKAFDIATVSSIWQAVQFEAEEVLGLTKADGDAFYEHVARRAEEIVKKTQPTFDTNNRSGLSNDKTSLARFITMFGSARSKLAMLMIEGAVDLMNNPTTENKHKFVKRSVNIMVLSAAAVVVVDILKTLTLGTGFDDPEEDIPEFAAYKMISTVLGNFYGISQIADVVISNIDDEPWRRQIQDPFSALAQDASAVIWNTFNGDFDKAALKALETTMKATGAPLSPYLIIKNIVKRTN